MKTSFSIGELKTHRLISDRLRQAILAKEFSLIVLFPTLSLLNEIQEELLDQAEIAGIGGLRLLLFEGFIAEIRRRFSLNQRTPSALAREFLMTETFGRLKAEGKIDYLAKVPFTAGYRQAMLAGVAEWQRSCLTPEIFGRWAAAQGPKEEQLALVFQVYQELLQQRGFTGEDLTLRELQELAQKRSADEGRSRVILYGFTDLTPLQRKYISILATWFDFELIIDPTGVPEIQHFISRHFTPVSGIEAVTVLPVNALQKLQACLWTREPEPAVLDERDPSLQMIRVSGWTKQAVAIGREIIRLLRENPGYRPEDFLIISPLPQSFLKAAVPVFQEYRLPLAKEAAAMKEYPGVKRFYQGLTAVGEDWLWPEMAVFIRQHYCGDQAAEGDRILMELGERYGALSGRKRWLNLIKNAVFQQYCAEKNLNPAPLKKAVDFLEALPDRAALKEYLKLARQWFITTAVPHFQAGGGWRWRIENLQAVERLVRVIDEVVELLDNSALKNKDIDLREFRSFWADYFLPLENKPPAIEPAVRVLVPQEARGLKAKVVFITSLEQGVFPRYYISDWKLPPKARRELAEFGAELETGEEYLTQEKLAFYWSLQAAKERLYLVFQEQDSNGQPLNHSLFLDEIWQWFPGLRARAQTYPPAPEPPAGFAGCYSKSEEKNRLALYLAAPGRAIPVDDYQTCRELLRIPHYREMARQIQALLKSHNKPGQALFANPASFALLERLFGEERTFAITALEDYNSCPYRFFLKHVLGIRPLIKPEFLPDHLELGNLYHQVLQEFGDHYRGNSLTGEDFQEYQKVLNGLFVDFYREWRENSANDLVNLVLSLMEAEIRTVLTGWLQSELRWAEESGGRFKISFLEFGFGLPQGDCDPASLPEPYQLDSEGVRVKIWGKIDRIDRDPEGGFIVYDYKSGRGPAVKDILAGDFLQIPVYLQALEELGFGEGRAAGGSYLGLKSPSHSRSGVWNKDRLRISLSGKGLLTEAEWREWLAKVRTGIAGTVRGIRGGKFFPNPDQCLPHCEYRNCCRPTEREVEKADETPAE